MTGTPGPTLDSFQSALLHELRQVVADSATSRTSARPRVRPRSRRRGWTVIAVGGVVGVAMAVGLIGPGAAPRIDDPGGSETATPSGSADPRPVYALTAADDGAVEIDVRRLEDAAGLQAAIERAGVSAYVRYLPQDTVCARPWFTNPTSVGPGDAAAIGELVLSTGGYHLSLHPAAIPDDQTLVIVMSPMSDHSVRGMVALAASPVGECRQVPAPEMPAEPDTGSGGLG